MVDLELTADVVDLLRRPSPAVMATLRPDGAPVNAATWYLWDNGRILLNLDAADVPSTSEVASPGSPVRSIVSRT
jgi:hypothetical protein